MKHLLNNDPRMEKKPLGGLWRKIGGAFGTGGAEAGIGHEIRGLDDIFPESIGELTLAPSPLPVQCRSTTAYCSSSAPGLGKPATRTGEPILRFEASLIEKVRWPGGNEPAAPAQAVSSPAIPKASPAEWNALDHLGRSNRMVNRSINSLVDRYFQKSAGESTDGIPC